MRGVACFFIFIIYLFADTSLIYNVQKGEKKLGLYATSFYKNRIISHSSGVSKKIKFFTNKDILFVQEGFKKIVFQNNDKKYPYTIKTSFKALNKEERLKYKRHLKRVKKDKFLLITVPQKPNFIELFNPRKTTILTLDEILSLIINSKINKEMDFILFDKLGIMKMIAKIIPTDTGFDIINKSKDKKYIQIVVKNHLPVTIKSYISNWKLVLQKSAKLSKNIFKGANIYEQAIEQKLNSVDAKLLKVLKIKQKNNKPTIYYKAEFKLSKNLSRRKKKKECKKLYKKIGTKYKNKIIYKNDKCILSLKTNIEQYESGDIVSKILKDQYKELKITNNIFTEGKDTIFYLTGEKR
jgi:hypothetical protein